MYVENGWLSLYPIYLPLLHVHKFSDNFSDMDGFQDGDTSERRVFCNTILLKYHASNIIFPSPIHITHFALMKVVVNVYTKVEAIYIHIYIYIYIYIYKRKIMTSRCIVGHTV